jgi:hypothetical protein
LNNLAATVDQARIEPLRERLAALAACTGAGCRAAEDAPLDAP